MDPTKIAETHPRFSKFLERTLVRFPWMEKRLRSLSFVKKQVDKEQGVVLAEMEKALKPYKKFTKTHATLPESGISRPKILAELKKLKSKEENRWKDGFVSGAVYHGDKAHIDFVNSAYALHSQTNPLHSDLWPSINKFEAEIISMTARMLGGTKDAEICGSLSSGGTESIMLAMKTYRDRARDLFGITKPNMVVSQTAHAAFDKASQYFKIQMKKIPAMPDGRADAKAMMRATNRNTIVMVGSAPTFPHGVIDPIRELSEFARERNIGFHTDACLGGFVLPFARKLGYHVPPFDFSLPGVTSMSADTHKYGYAAKGTSVVLYRRESLRQYQYYTVTDWPGGLYFSPTFAGSRPGGLIAACWAAMLSMGEKGYIDAVKKILLTGHFIKSEIAKIPELRVIGEPLFVISFESKSLDIYRVMDFMTKRHWNLNGLHRPSCVHIALTLRHAQPGVAKRFIKDLRAAVSHVKAHPQESGGLAPVYGMAATLPVRSLIGDLLKKYMDLLYRT